ncbi:MAG: hypothetical protein A2W99_00825 [Bacteroidetes bacterium GWF2_33_16]|nr:MAG: hypothetical protein A2X00_03530 [Bacteroidetes bacterium GWE2_32_14]OFY08809.1 MAG: hypothetical protein A2W99_00825 [Bacteroidetes bacterium GWF2_33_16]
MKRLAIGLVMVLVFGVISAQEIIHDRTYQDNIKTAIIYVEDNEISFPSIDLQGNRKLNFTFDDLDADIKSYTYTITHCNSDWTISNLFQTDYIDGYYDERVNEYQSSFNTLINYTHYTITIPNEYLKPKLSGNYIIQIFDSNSPGKPIITKRFLITEYHANVDANVKSLSQPGYFFNDQELEIKLDFSGSDLYNPSQNTKLVVLKNHNWNEQILVTKPDKISDQEITYNNYQFLKFKGGNEYYSFNTKHIRTAIGSIMNIDFIDNMYHFQLYPNTDRTFKDYIYEPDINGKFKIDVDNASDPATEADYVYVYFTLLMDVPVQNGDIYIFGALTNYGFSNESKMVYNFEQKTYECRMLLKQGFYNYQYVLMENNKPDYTYLEGNHAQTENTYTILVYYYDYRGNYDRLIGVKEISSVVK